MARTAQVKRDARIGEAEARRDAGIRVIMTITITAIPSYYTSIQSRVACVQWPLFSTNPDVYIYIGRILLGMILL